MRCSENLACLEHGIDITEHKKYEKEIARLDRFDLMEQIAGRHRPRDPEPDDGWSGDIFRCFNSMKSLLLSINASIR